MTRFLLTVLVSFLIAAPAAAEVAANKTVRTGEPSDKYSQYNIMNQSQIVIDLPDAQKDMRSKPMYPEPSKKTVLQGLVRLGALNLNDQRIMDDYMKVLECELFTGYFKDDFKWKQISDLQRSMAKRDVNKYPAGLTVTGKIRFDRYDFEENMIVLGVNTKIQDMNAFNLVFIGRDECNRSDLDWIPENYIAVLDKKVSVPGLPMPKEQADALFARMKAEGNEDRIVMARFNVRLMYSEPIVPPKQRYHGKKRYYYIDTILESIEFYEDKHMRKLITVFEP